MKHQPTAIVGLLFALLMAGCAIEPPEPPSHFTLAHDDFYAKVRTIAIAPLATPPDFENPTPVAAKFEMLIVKILRDGGYSVVSSTEYAAILDQAKSRQGGYFDPLTGKLDEAKYDAILKAARHDLSAKFKVDAVLYPSILAVDAKWFDQTAYWDGATDSIQSFTGLVEKGVVKFVTEPETYLIGKGPHEEGTVKAYSLAVLIEDVDGNKLYANQGGIQVLSKMMGNTFIPLFREDLFNDEARNTKAVDIALEAVSRAECETDFQVPPCNVPRMAVNPDAAKRLVFVVQGSKVSISKDWELFRTEWNNAIAASAASHGIEVSVRDTPSISAPETAVLAVVTINDFKYISKKRYYWVGVMSGSPYINAEVDFYELPGKTFLIKRQYRATALNHATCSPEGVCTSPPMTEKQIKILCDAIVAELARH